MSDLSTMRGLLTAITFIGVSVLFISLIPSGFYAEEYEGLTVEPPEVFEGIDIQSFAETCSFEMNETGGADKGNYYMMPLENDQGEWLGGHDLDFFYKDANETNLDLYIAHWYSKWIFFLVQDAIVWYNEKGVSRGVKLDENELDEDYTKDEMEYTGKCKHLEIRIFFGFNDTLYSSPSQAWDYHGLSVFIGINFDQVATGYSAWDLIGMLLFFQLPNVHWYINALISIPLWVCIAYVTTMLIYKAIEAIKPFS